MQSNVIEFGRNSMATVELKIEKYFVVEKCIGKGSFSAVFQVRNVKNNRRYALKKVFVEDIVDDKAKADCFNEVNLLQVGILCCQNHVTFQREQPSSQ